MDAHRATRRRIMIGLIISATLLAVAAVIFFLDEMQQWTADTYEIVVVLPDAEALREGGVVRVAGNPVGRVSEVELPRQPWAGPARVTATVELPTEVRPHVRRESRARIVREGLGGAAIIAIEPGPRDSPPLAAGDTLTARPPPDTDRLAQRGRAVLAAWDSLGATLAEMRAAIDAGPTSTERASTLEAIEAARVELDRLRARYRAGPLAAMIRDPGWRRSIDRVRRAVAAVRETFEGRPAVDAAAPAAEVVERGRAIGATLRRVVAQADSLRARLARLEERMRLGGGLPYRLATDTALQAALRGVRAQLDSLIAEARADPFRFIF